MRTEPAEATWYAGTFPGQPDQVHQVRRAVARHLMDTIAVWAKELARTLLAEALPRRWAHVQGVAARARSLAPALGPDAGLIEAAAWLHDIGYHPNLIETGLHGLDGARHLRDAHRADEMLCRLVAHHSCAVIEAEERGLADVLTREFPPPPRPLADALTFCDMTTSPDGQHVQVHNRLAEIHDRYGTGHLVSRSIRRATPLILEAVGQINAEAALLSAYLSGHGPMASLDPHVHTRNILSMYRRSE